MSEFYNPEIPIINVIFCNNIAYTTEIFHLSFWINFGAMATSFASLKLLLAYLNFYDDENPTIHANVSIACTELKSVQFWFIFA